MIFDRDLANLTAAILARPSTKLRQKFTHSQRNCYPLFHVLVLVLLISLLFRLVVGDFGNVFGDLMSSGSPGLIY
jgi:hypothetical protein